MCRSIKTLRRADQPATQEEIHAAALQFVRKVSGYRAPSAANGEAFDAAVTRHTAHIRHLEKLVLERERIIVERDQQLEQSNTAREERDRNIAALEKQVISLEVGRTRLESERTRLQAALAAQERAIAYLQSFRGWIGWPWRQARQRTRRSR